MLVRLSEESLIEVLLRALELQGDVVCSSVDGPWVELTMLGSFNQQAMDSELGRRLSAALPPNAVVEHG